MRRSPALRIKQTRASCLLTRRVPSTAELEAEVEPGLLSDPESAPTLPPLDEPVALSRTAKSLPCPRSQHSTNL